MSKPAPFTKAASPPPAPRAVPCASPAPAARLLALRAFAVIFPALWLLHLPLLRLPYFWDEAGYFIPAAHDLLQTGTLIPFSTLSNAHPPLVMLWLALCWKLTAATPLVTRTAMLLVAAFGFTALWLLARRITGAQTAAATVLLTALSPTVFTQSAMAQLDIAAFALVLWTVYAYLFGRRWQAVLFATLAVVAKETTIAIPLTLAVVDALGCAGHRWQPAWAARHRLPRRTLAQSASLLLPLPALLSWYVYHYRRTGHLLGNPDYLRYNVGATLTPWRILIAFGLRLWHVIGYMNLFVLTAAALLLLWSARREAPPRATASSPTQAAPGPAGIAPEIQCLFLLLVLAQAAEFSLVGGALLARYMIPALPLVILLSVDIVHRYAPRWPLWIAACAASFLAALVFNPPWSIAPEDNLTWTHFVEMHEQAARYLESHYAGDRILTAWPASDELSHPYLGYVAQPLHVVPAENFTTSEMLRAATREEDFDVVLAFSTKFEPARTLLPHFAAWSRLQTRYFDYHRDLTPTEIAHLLHGQIAWQHSSPGEWVSIIELDKIRNARLRPPARRSAPRLKTPQTIVFHGHDR